MSHLTIITKKNKEVVDITDLVNEEVGKAGVENGLVHVFLTHTTAAVTTADLDPGTDLDLLDAFEKIIPKLPYRHPHDPAHMPDHILSSLIGTSLTLTIENGELALGTWQRIVLIEWNGPKDRHLIITIP